MLTLWTLWTLDERTENYNYISRPTLSTLWKRHQRHSPGNNKVNCTEQKRLSCLCTPLKTGIRPLYHCQPRDTKRTRRWNVSTSSPVASSLQPLPVLNGFLLVCLWRTNDILQYIDEVIYFPCTRLPAPNWFQFFRTLIIFEMPLNYLGGWILSWSAYVLHSFLDEKFRIFRRMKSKVKLKNVFFPTLE